MKPNKLYANQTLEFWATVKLLSQKLGYTERKTRQIKVPTIEEVVSVYKNSNLNTNKIFYRDSVTDLGKLILDYFRYRADVLNSRVQTLLMNKEDAESLFKELVQNYLPKCPLPYNKQSGNKKNHAFFTCIVNILIEANLGGYSCNYSASELTAFTQHNFSIRSLSRRVDGSFPSVINPVALWEIKEYYYTKSFGSRVADGIYETMLDSYELQEVRRTINLNVQHYLMIDDHYTWWVKGKSYLCRLIDMMQMGLVSEVLFGREVIERIPQLANDWIFLYEQHKDILEK